MASFLAEGGIVAVVPSCCSELRHSQSHLAAALSRVATTADATAGKHRGWRHPEDQWFAAVTTAAAARRQPIGSAQLDYQPHQRLAVAVGDGFGCDKYWGVPPAIVVLGTATGVVATG